jgi:hypothetical protein
VDVEEFRAAIRELRVQARRAYNEQLEVVRMLSERSKLQQDALPLNMSGDASTTPQVNPSGPND